MFDLIVTEPFGTFEVGQRITDPDQVAALMAGGNQHSVTRVAAQPEPEAPAVEEKPAEAPQGGQKADAATKAARSGS